MKQQHESENQAREALKTKSLKATPHRLRLLSLLIESPQPMTHAQLMAAIGPGVNRVTIYRALHAFVEQGLVHQFVSPDQVWHFSFNESSPHQKDHPHFTCHRCHSSRCLSELSLDISKHAQLKGLLIDQQDLQLLGLCQDCQGEAA